MPDILVIGFSALIAVAVYLLPAPEAGQRFPLKWRITISGLAVLTIVAALWQQKNTAQEKQEARDEFQAARQQYAVDIAIVKTRLEDLALAVAKAAEKAPELLPLADRSRALAQLPAHVSFYRQTLVTFVHGLNSRAPRITCLDSEGKPMYPGAITPLDENTTVINLVTPLTGSCSAQR
jgi:hypothetical protein